MIGKTNVISQIGAGDETSSTLTIVNKTGSTINKGDKVWISEDVRSGDSYFVVGSSADGIIAPSGLCAVVDSYLYTLDGNSATRVKASGRFSEVCYHGSYVIGNYSTNNTQVLKSNDCITLNGKYKLIENSDNLFVKYKDTKNIYKIDLDTGEILQTWTGSDDINALGTYNWVYQLGNSVVVGNYVVDLSSDGLITNQRSLNGMSSNSQAYLTKDNAHLVTLLGSKIFIYKIIDAENVELLPQTDLPEDLQNLSDWTYFLYNRNNDIITMTKQQSKYSTECLVIKHNKGKVEKLNLTFPFGEDGINVSGSTAQFKYFTGFVSFTDDMSRAHVVLGAGSACRQIVVNFTSNSGYVAVPYKTYAVNEDSITGIARENADDGASLEVNVAQNVVDE